MKHFIDIALVIAAVTIAGCSTAKYQIIQKGTWALDTPFEKQPVTPKILHSVKADAPGGKAAIVIVYFGADKAPLMEAKGDSSALVQAIAAVGRKAFDLAVKLAKASGVSP